MPARIHIGYTHLTSGLDNYTLTVTAGLVTFDGGTLAFNNSTGITYVIWYFKTAGNNNYTVDIYDANATLLATKTVANAHGSLNDFHDFTTPNAFWCGFDSDSFYVSGLDSTLRTSQGLVNYLSSLNGFLLPMNFPNHSNILPQP